MGEQQQKAQQVSGASDSLVKGVGAAFGPVGAAAAGLEVGVNKMLRGVAQNGNGIYKSKGAQIASYFLDPVMMGEDLLSGSFNQKKLQDKHDFMQRLQTNQTMEDQVAADTKLTNATPSFEAPAYGRRGMKLGRKYGITSFRKTMRTPAPPLRNYR